MIIFFYLIPFFAILSAITLYRLNGRKEFLKLDLVQFFYAFILAPALFVWLKTFLYYLLRSEVAINLGTGLLFVIDTLFSVLFLYIFAFVVIHSLTKSFWLQRSKDPLYNLFEHSEFFHLWLTHLIMYVGSMAIVSILSSFNLFFPLDIEMTRSAFYVVFGSGFVSGLFVFMIVWLSDPKQEEANFMRLMKLFFGFFFLIHVVLYFVFNPPFTPALGLYWWSLNLFTALVICSLFAYKSERALTMFDKIAAYFKHSKWGHNIELFKKINK